MVIHATICGLSTALLLGSALSTRKWTLSSLVSGRVSLDRFFVRGGHELDIGYTAACGSVTAACSRCELLVWRRFDFVCDGVSVDRDGGEGLSVELGSEGLRVHFIAVAVILVVNGRRVIVIFVILSDVIIILVVLLMHVMVASHEITSVYTILHISVLVNRLILQNHCILLLH